MSAIPRQHSATINFPQGPHHCRPLWHHLIKSSLNKQATIDQFPFNFRSMWDNEKIWASGEPNFIMVNLLLHVNSLRPSDAYMRQ